jgi:hypothetical protein
MATVEAKQDPVVALTLASARDGGYVVHTAHEPPRYNGLIFAGSLRECLDYMAKHFGAEAKTANLRPVS